MQKLSTLADDLWPYLVGRVARVNRNGGGRVNVISEGGSETLAELTDVALGALSDGQLLGYEASTGKWQNVVGAAGGGITYTAGNGITISGTTIATKQQAAGGVRADGSGLYILLDSENGLKLDSNGLAVGAGNGINVVGNLTSVHLGIKSGLNFDPVGGGLVVDATLAGAGLGWDDTNKIMSVNVTEGLEYTGDSVRVDEDYAFIWEASHRFNATPQMNANINFIGADRTITSAAGIDLTFDLGADLILASAKTFRSADYLDDIPIAGFSLFPNTGGDRQLTINTIKSDSLHTRLFVADGVRIDIGEERWGKSMGIVHDDFFVPTLVGNSVYVFFEDSPMLGTAPLFSVNDWVLFRYLNQGSNFAFGSVWGQVSGYIDWGLDGDGRGHQRWVFTLRHGDAGVLIKKDNIAVDYGASGQGFAMLSVLSDAVGPWFRIGTWSGANPYTPGNTQIRTQIGNLAGISDTVLNPTGYGLYSDNAYLHGMLRTAETMMDDDGLAIEYQVDDNIDAGVHAQLSWWPDVAGRVGNPPARLAAWQSNADPSNLFDTVDLQVRKSDDSVASVIYLSTVDGTPNAASLVIDSRATIALHAASNIFYGNALPGVDLSYDLGTTSLRWRNLYVDHLYVTGAISGDVLSGQEWEYPGSMIIDAHGTGDLTVTITNQGTGQADLVVERNISLGGTIDGVDISTHVSDPNAHHAIASGADGITVASGQIISVDGTVVRTPATVLRTTQSLATDAPLTGGGQLGDGLTLRLLLAAVNPGLTAVTGGLGVLLAATTPGLSLTGGLAVDASVARTTVSMIAGLGLTGGGTLAADRTLNVGAGDGITVNADDVAVNATVVRTSLTLTAGAGLTGGGSLAANRTFDVVAGNGTLTVSADSMVVNQAFTFAWTGTQTWAAAATFNGVPTFNSAPQINANLAFIGADRTMTASANLTVQPAANLTLDPTGGTVYLPDDVEERSSTFADLVTGIQGFRLWSPTATTRQLVIGGLKADSFSTRTFVADTVRLEQGESYWGKGYGIVNTDFVLPAINADVSVWFDNVPSTAGNIFTVGDKLLARFIVWTAGVSTKTIWFNVQAFVSADDPNFRQQWTLRRLSGGATGDAVIKGVVLEDAGSTGQGWIHVTALSGGPYMEFGTQTSVAAGVPQFTQNVRIGQLSGTVDYVSSAWGFATGNNLGIGPTAGFSGITIDNSVQGMRVFNAAYQLFNGANLILNIEKVNGISFEYGTAAFNSIGWYDDLGTGTPSGLLGTVGVSRSTGTFTELDVVTTAIAGSYPNAAVRLRAVSAALSAYNLWLDSGGVYFGTGSASAAQPQTGGFITNTLSYLAGSVGIGTASAASKLDVQDTVDGDVRVRIGNNYVNAASADDSATLDFSFYSTAQSALRSAATIAAIKTDNWTSSALRLARLAFSVSNGAVFSEMMTILPSGFVGIGTPSPSWLQHNMGQLDGGKVVALALHNNTITDNSEVAIRFVNRNTSITSEADRVGELSVSGGTGRASIIGRVSDTSILATAFTASATLFYVPNTLGLGLSDPDAPLTIVGSDATLANGKNQIRLRGQRQTINAGTFALLGGIDFMSNDTQLTAPGVVTAAIQGIATTTHNLTALDSGIRIMTTTGTTYAEHSRFHSNGMFQVLGGINFGGTTMATYDENSVGWNATITAATTAPTVTYTTRQSWYTRVGNTVHFQIYLLVNLSGGTGTIRISLPVTAAAGQLQHTPIVFLKASTITGGSLLIQPGTAYGQIYMHGGVASYELVQNLSSSAAWFYASGSYFV